MWKLFSTVFTNRVYYQRAISDGSNVVDGANNVPNFDLGGGGTARTIVPPVGYPKANPNIYPAVHVNGLTPAGPAEE